MKHMVKKHKRGLITGLFVAVFSLVSFGVGAPYVRSFLPEESWIGRGTTISTLSELERLGLLSQAPEGTLEDLLAYQRRTGKTLAEILRDPSWSERLGLTSEIFKATWYAANPFELLPPDLRKAIRRRKTPFRSRNDVWQWCRQEKAPSAWRKALKAALVETTPHNLWRASRGQKPYARNGEFLEPIVRDLGRGQFEIREGHIATDPKIIPTNSEVLLLVKINGEDKLLRVKATDIGSKIRGRHVDLPIHLGPENEHFPHTRFPREVRNPFVQILKPMLPANASNPNQKVG